MLGLKGKMMMFKEKILWKSWTKIGCETTFIINLVKIKVLDYSIESQSLFIPRCLTRLNPQ